MKKLLRKKNRIAALVVGWAMYNDCQIKKAIKDLANRGEMTPDEAKWAKKNIERMVYLECEFQEEFMYF